MKKRILKFIDSMGVSDSITSKELSQKLSVNEKKINNVFTWLIDNEKVIKITNKEGIEIAPSRGVDYSLMHKEMTQRMSIKTKITLTISILTFIVFVAINWDKIISFFN
jgi:hypothetical protein